MTDLAQKVCVACEGGMPPLVAEEITRLKSQIPNWTVSDDQKSITREFKFKNWKQAIEFTNTVSDIAEAEGHHPDLFITWGKVRIVLTTHAIGGLSENDFIVAAKIDKRHSQV